MPTIDNDNNIENKTLNLEEKSIFDEKKLQISKFVNQIKEKMQTMEKEIWVIDRFEGDFAICENRENKEKRKVEIEKLPKSVKEGSVLKVEDGKYALDLEEQEKIEKRIEEKMKNIWND